MARLNVNATRVELKNLSQRLQTAKRGHALLKEKQDALVRYFQERTEQAGIQRRMVEEKSQALFKNYYHASIETDERILQHSLNTQEHRLQIDTTLKNIMGVKVPNYQVISQVKKKQRISTAYTPLVMNELVVDDGELAQELIALAEVEKHCFLIGEEIIATRRRVNSLEYKTIPDLSETIVYIKMKIEEEERAQIAKLLQL